MKTILFFISILFFSGCSNRETSEQIKKFEEVLGKENSETLTFLVDDFENVFLKKRYPNLSTEKAYTKILSEVNEKSGVINYKMMSSAAQKKFEESQLKWELAFYSDSVWIDENKIKARLIYKDDEGQTEFMGESVLRMRKGENIDSLIRFQKNTSQFSTQGKYMRALKGIEENNSFFQNYYDAKSKVGAVANFIIPNMIERYKLNTKGYIARRIIVLELGYL